MVIVITDIVKCKSKVLKIRDWIKTNADRITVGVLSLIIILCLDCYTAESKPEPEKDNPPNITSLQLFNNLVNTNIYHLGDTVKAVIKIYDPDIDINKLYVTIHLEEADINDFTYNINQVSEAIEYTIYLIPTMTGDYTADFMVTDKADNLSQLVIVSFYVL
jgi:hypothetical protein